MIQIINDGVFLQNGRLLPAAQCRLSPEDGRKKTIAYGILERRAEYGRFFSVDELLDVSGVGKVTLEKLRPYVCVE